MTERTLFQLLDTKADCAGYYVDNFINAGGRLPMQGETWEYSSHLPGPMYEVAQIYSAGATLTEVCPAELQEEWEQIKKRLKACLKAFNTAELSLAENCLYDLLPEYFLFQYLHAKNKITAHVLDTVPRPANYKMIYQLVEMLADIKEQPLSINVTPIGHLLGSVKGKNFLRTLQTVKPVCDYNPWGTVTGRLASRPRTFPILTMGKEFRACVKPRNDWFIELDFNAAELRVLLALSGVEQPPNDIHDWNTQHIFANQKTREETKRETFAWLYSQRSNSALERLYDKTKVRERYWDGTTITTDYGRIIRDVDAHHALNYIVQSTTIDMVHEQAYKLYQILRNRRSYISFLIHDAVYIDLAEEDRYEILNLLDTFKKTRYNVFKVNVSAGKNLGEMKELKL
jgi:hypothetical protein